MKILSFGAGMQSTALALMSCENAMISDSPPNPAVPIYDLVIYCDLGMEPPWVYKQMEFVRDACEKAGIRFEKLDTHLYEHLMTNYGERRTVSIPWWTVNPDDGKKGKVSRRFCTLDFKTAKISKFIKHEVLGYRKFQRKMNPADLKGHEMHLGFSAEEKKRCKENPHPFFVNRFPLVDMGWTRAESYRYCLDVWGIDLKASACSFCPYHTNYFFNHLKEEYNEHYQQLLEVDHLLQDKKPHPSMNNRFFISRSHKRLEDLSAEDCQDMQCFTYSGKYAAEPIQVWNGF